MSDFSEAPAPASPNAAPSPAKRPAPGIMPAAPKPGGGAPPPPGGPAAPAGGQGTGDAPPVINKKIPKSPFDSGKADTLPEMDLTPLEELDTKITIEYCLEAAARVLEDLAEMQEEQTWVPTYVTLAEQWKAMAEMLINYKITTKQLEGDALLKQQQAYFDRDLHAQQMAQNDQLHMQTMTQKQEQHEVGLKQQDEEHSFKKKAMDDEHKVKMDVTKKSADMNLAAQKAKTDAAKKQAAQAAKPKPTPKKA